VKGNRDDYAHFLARARTQNANLLDLRSPFRFEIKSWERSSFILRSGFAILSALLQSTLTSSPGRSQDFTKQGSQSLFDPRSH
jgi:hypothetical protein